MTGLGWRGARPAVWGAEKLYYRAFRNAPRGEFRRINAVLGGLHAQTLVYHLTSRPRWWFLRDEWRAETDGETAYDQLEFDTSRLKRWHPLNQSLYMGYKTQLPGLLLNHRGDRAAMANSVETRYPFLDESVIDLCCRIDPRWKLRGLTGDKHLLRLTARRLLPKRLAMRPKRMFLAPFANTLLTGTIPYVEQLLSAESLRRTPYFSPERVDEVFSRFRRGAYAPPVRLFYEMALCAVVGTQLWHHLFVGGGLCDLPSWTPPVVDSGECPSHQPAVRIAASPRMTDNQPICSCKEETMNAVGPRAGAISLARPVATAFMLAVTCSAIALAQSLVITNQGRGRLAERSSETRQPGRSTATTGTSSGRFLAIRAEPRSSWFTPAAPRRGIRRSTAATVFATSFSIAASPSI